MADAENEKAVHGDHAIAPQVAARIHEKEVEEQELRRSMEIQRSMDIDRSRESRIPSADQDIMEEEDEEEKTTPDAPSITTQPDRAQRPGLTRHYTKLANKEAHPWQHWGITLGGPMIVLFDIVVPIIIYYSWYNKQQANWANECNPYWSQKEACPTPQPEDFDSDIMGSAVASFGIGELWILLARVYRLIKQRDQCAPLLSRARWELDATAWVYGVAMIVALIPFVVGSSLVMPKLFLYGPSFLMAFLGVLMFVTTFIPIKLPIGINSHPRGSRIRPFIYYAAEDFIAVDGLQDREFRVRYNARYETNPRFRRFFVYLTILWQFGVLTFIGCVSAVIWTLPFHVAFGLSLGVLFGYIGTFAGITYVWVMIEMKKERELYEHSEV